MRPQRFRRTLIAALFALTPGLAVAQSAPNIFLVDSSDGYGIDACVASGAACGQAMADAWCRVHDFQRASSFGKVKSDAMPVSVTAKSVSTATGTVAITCK